MIFRYIEFSFGDWPRKIRSICLLGIVDTAPLLMAAAVRAAASGKRSPRRAKDSDGAGPSGLNGGGKSVCSGNGGGAAGGGGGGGGTAEGRAGGSGGPAKGDGKSSRKQPAPKRKGGPVTQQPSAGLRNPLCSDSVLLRQTICRRLCGLHQPQPCPSCTLPEGWVWNC